MKFTFSSCHAADFETAQTAQKVPQNRTFRPNIWIFFWWNIRSAKGLQNVIYR